MNFTEFLFKHYWILKNVYNKLHEVTYSAALYNLKDAIIQLYITTKTDKKRDLQKNWQKDGKLQVNPSPYSYSVTPNRRKFEGPILLDI